jgi:hypothetical protein
MNDKVRSDYDELFLSSGQTRGRVSANVRISVLEEYSSSHVVDTKMDSRTLDPDRLTEVDPDDALL